jgi:cytoskeletal protein RodZ
VTLTLSPQIKIVALVGLVAALVLGAGSFVLAHMGNSTNAPVPAPARPVHRTQAQTAAGSAAKAPAAKKAPASGAAATMKPHAAKHAAAAPASSKAQASKARAATSPAAKAPAAKAPATTVQVQVPAATGSELPAALVKQLRRHPVVVVALFDREVPADGIALSEARAGARDVHAGFLAVNLLDAHLTGPLTASAGDGTVLPDPGVLVYRRPGVLMNRLDGFADRAAVAQAAATARVAEHPAPGS